MNYLELAQKGFAIAAGVLVGKVIAENHPSEKGTYMCSADLGEVAFEGTFTLSKEGDHGVACITTERDGHHWSYPHSWHHLWSILSKKPEAAHY